MHRLAQEEDQTLIHKLPPEVLVLIFSRLRVQDLSTNVSRVCVRWRDTLKCKILWQDKEIVYETGKECFFINVLQIAVSLKKIILTPIVCEQPRKLSHAILTGPKDVEEFHYNLSLFPSVIGTRILRYFRDYVRELHLVGCIQKQNALQRNLSSVLAQMVQLQKLKLSGYFDSKWDVDVLQQGCSTLKYLDVCEIQDECDSYLPLLDSVKDHLESLKLPQCNSNTDVLSLVSCCLQLKEITLCLDDVRCISTLHSLEALHIKWAHTAPRSRLNKFIKECPVFGCLKELTLHYISGSIALAIVKRCHSLQTLSIHGITTCTEIIKCVPSVEKLTVVDNLSLKTHHLIPLPELLPKLQILDLRGCFLSCGVPPKIISQLRKQLPSLEIISNPFVDGTP